MPPKFDVCISFSAPFREADILVDEEEGVMYVNDDMSLAETESVDEMAYEVRHSTGKLN